MSVSVLAVDLGKTGCRAALWVDGSRTDADGLGAPGLASPGGAALAEAAILAVVTRLLRAAGLEEVETAGVGAAGVLAASGAARQLAACLCSSLPARRVAVASDAVTSHAGALGGGPGVVLAAGTGAVALAIGADGTQRQADGWGPWLGDEGSGAWLGLHGLRAALRAMEGRGPATALQAAAERRFGPPPALVAALEGHENPPRLAASFAVDVARAAEAGDTVAAGLVCGAAAALAGTVRSAAAPLAGAGPVRFAMVGGLASLGPVLVDPLLEALRRDAAWLQPAVPDGTALDGARLLALRRDTLHEGGIVRAAGTAGGDRP